MERRKFTRFRVQDDAFAALRGSSNTIGKIYDISLNGLAFRNIAEKFSDKTFTHADIFLTSDAFHLFRVPCTIIYDVKESTNYLNDVVPYRCGLKFEPLQDEQQNKLEFFINNHTIGVLSS